MRLCLLGATLILHLVATLIVGLEPDEMAGRVAPELSIGILFALHVVTREETFDGVYCGGVFHAQRRRFEKYGFLELDLRFVELQRCASAAVGTTAVLFRRLVGRRRRRRRRAQPHFGG